MGHQTIGIQDDMHGRHPGTHTFVIWEPRARWRNPPPGQPWGSASNGAQSGLGPGLGWGPYGHLWVHMGPYGSSWIGLGRLRKLSVRLSDKFRTFRVQKWYFDGIYR